MNRALIPPDLRVITIPTSDAAFAQNVDRLVRTAALASAPDLELRLRRLFPRAVVRERGISGEPPSWYVYRDGGWRPSTDGPWWQAPALPRIVASPDGWIVDASPTALGLLGLDRADLGARHFTDFVAPGTLADAEALFRIVAEGNDLAATVLLRPTSGDIVAIDIRASRKGDTIEALLRLANDVELDTALVDVPRPVVTAIPATDAAFRGYVQLALARMPEPSVDGLALRLRRLYPHASVTDDGDHWVARRDSVVDGGEAVAWWLEPGLPRVRYDAQALILEANDAARRLLGSPLVGHYWQEFVTPGSTEQVGAMLAILAEVGGAESRFRMPAADGSLVEFDSYTEVDGESFTTTMRPRP